MLIPPLVFAKYCQADIRRIKAIAQVSKTSPALELASPSILRFTMSVGVVTMTLLGTSLGSVFAQMPSIPERMLLGERTMSQVQVVFVNPSIGDDTGGNGSENSPVKTITQALRLATDQAIIMLSPGTYSVETGEVFPLMLKSGVAIQGDAQSKGKGIRIQGGGEYLSRSFGGQNVTIVGANQAGLTGVTVINPNPRGYGLWIESSNPVISENTFTGSTQDGISVAGNGAPTINKNYFYRNGANGITISGNSQAQVRENIFQETGFGINIAQNAAPVVFGNQIQNNRSGIIVQAKARPILRNNIIENNQEDGLVAIAQAMPDLGSATEAGGNEFRNNTRYDINASAAKQMISAAGNTLGSNRIAGKVDINAQTASVSNNSPLIRASNSTIPTIPISGEISVAAPQLPRLTSPSQRTTRSQSSSQRRSSQLLPLPPADIPLILPRDNQQPPTPISNTLAAERPTAIQITAREMGTLSSGNQPDTPQLNYVQIDRNTVEFVAPALAEPPEPESYTQVTPLPPRRVTQRPSLTGLEAAPLAVPTGNIPIGDARALRKVPVSQYTTAYGGNYLSPVRGEQTGVRYRVVVEAPTDREQELVRFFAPGAFPTVWQGRRVMQAGVFSNRYNADEMLKILNSNGLRTIVEQLN